MKMFQMSVVLILLASYGVRSEPSRGGKCLRTFQELERSLVARDINLDGMRDAFFPPNRQKSVAVTVYYFFDNGELYDEQNLNPLSYRYAFRWSASPILEFIRPELLRYMSMFIYHGHATTIH